MSTKDQNVDAATLDDDGEDYDPHLHRDVPNATS